VKRRTVLAGASAIIASVLASGGPAAAADAYPERQITLVTGFAAGSGADVYARYYAAELATVTGQNVIVENRPGGFGSLAAVSVARAAPDGYTLFIGGADTFTATPYVFVDPPFDPRTDFAYVSPLFGQGFVLLVGADSPYETFEELTAALREKGTEGNYATSNNVSTILAEVYKNSLQLETQQIRYRATAETIPDIASGLIDFIVVDPVFGLARQREGSARLLAISTGEPISSVPDVAPFRDYGVDIDLNIWFVIAAPAGTPQDVQERLHRYLTQIASSDKSREFVGRNGGEPLTNASPAETQARVEAEIEDWATYVEIGEIEPQ
jgi:tripartite-type tricarboxylate transporter receptor subunit TctC